MSKLIFKKNHSSALLKSDVDLILIEDLGSNTQPGCYWMQTHAWYFNDAYNVKLVIR